MTTSELPLEAFTVLNALQLGLIERTADADVRSLAHTMAEHSVHSVVIRGIERPRSWGIVSDLDLMAAMRPESADATAGQLAATDPVVVDPGETLGRVRAARQDDHRAVRLADDRVRDAAEQDGSARAVAARADDHQVDVLGLGGELGAGGAGH